MVDHVQLPTDNYYHTKLMDKSMCITVSFVFTPHAQRERGKVIDRGVHMYIYMCVCGRKNYLNRTLEIDSPFQTLTVGLLVEFID